MCKVLQYTYSLQTAPTIHKQAACNITSAAQLRKRGVTLNFTNSTPGITMTYKGVPFQAAEDDNLYLLNLCKNQIQSVALPACSLKPD